MGNDKDDRLCCCKDAAGGGEGELESSLPLPTVSPCLWLPSNEDQAAVYGNLLYARRPIRCSVSPLSTK